MNFLGCLISCKHSYVFNAVSCDGASANETSLRRNHFALNPFTIIYMNKSFVFSINSSVFVIDWLIGASPGFSFQRQAVWQSTVVNQRL